jgi:hypothetical protein
MRSRRSDGLLIVILGLLALTAVLHALPPPPAELAAIIADDPAVVFLSALGQPGLGS